MAGFDSRVLLEWGPSLLQGLGVTIAFTVGALAIGLVIGLVIAICGLSRYSFLRLFARAYVDGIRGTPLLLQLFILYYALPSLGLKMTAVSAGLLGLGINTGAYLAEIFRAGIEAVPRAHVQAARSLGMSSWQTLIRIELPQSVGLVMPPFANEVISLVKSTSLISTIAIGELLRSGQIAVSITFAPFEIYMAVALLYLGLNLILSGLVRYLENRTGTQNRSEARRTLADVGV
jgi:His/Glu/Gln/Arg/opine family amino acid ABC transporter permease subunit